ncbi:MAG: hypothetical protein U0P45_14495 [Acidimicrobiales bacterium]
MPVLQDPTLSKAILEELRDVFQMFRAEDETAGSLPLDEWFITTDDYINVEQDRCWLIEGPKGTGKTALARALMDDFSGRFQEEARAGHPVLRVEAFPNDGESWEWLDPLIRYLKNMAVRERPTVEGSDRVWRLYCAGLVINAIGRFTSSEAGTSYRTQIDGHTLRKLRERLAAACRSEISGMPSLDGGKDQGNLYQFFMRTFRFAPDAAEAGERLQGDVSSALQAVERELQSVLAGSNMRCWVIVDRIDEIFSLQTEHQAAALGGFISAMQVLSASGKNWQCKLFIRTDLLERLDSTFGSIENIDRVLAHRERLRWSTDDIELLVLRRASLSPLFNEKIVGKKYDIGKQVDRRFLLYDVVFDLSSERRLPLYVRCDKKVPWRWLLTHCRDGRESHIPRIVLSAFSYAVDDRLKAIRQGQTKEIRGVQEKRAEQVLFFDENVKSAYSRVSDFALDTLRGTFSDVRPYLATLEGREPVWEDKDQLMERLRLGSSIEGDLAVDRLRDIGVIRMFKGPGYGVRYDVAPIYRCALNLSEVGNSGPPEAEVQVLS